MRDKKYLSVAAVVFLLIALAGCATGGYYYDGTSEVNRTYERAKVLYEQKQYDEAKTHFQQIIANHPKSPLVEVAMYYLASCHKEKKEYQKAISAYQELINKYDYGFWVDSAKKDIEKIKSAQKK